MIFTSFEFVLFFLFVLLIRNCLSRFVLEKWFLLVSSYVFYMSWSIPCAGLIFVTSLVDYLVGRELGRVQVNSHRNWLLGASLVANLGVLAFFKYTNFFLDNLWSGFNLLGIRLSPVHYDII